MSRGTSAEWRLGEGAVPYPSIPEYHIEVDFTLSPGDYWLTVWASNAAGTSASFAWFTNAPDGINVHCPSHDCVGPPPCGTPGAGGCDPDDCPGTAGATMMWRACAADCGDGDGTVGVVDFLALLGQWGQDATPCDIDGDGVGVTDFLALLACWGPCP